MKNWTLYRLLLNAVPPHGEVNESTLPPEMTRRLRRILRRHRCLGASLCVFDARQVTGTLTFGLARPGVPVTRDTAFRAASVSKFATGLAIMRLKEQGLDLDQDVNRFLPFSLRHPLAPETPITLRMLMAHTAGLRDGSAYNQGIAQGAPLSDILRGDSFADHLPGTLWEYSNLGAGIAGLVIEGAAKADFEAVMQETLFRPLQIDASFYPQRLHPARTLADARRILPPHRGPNFDAEARRRQPLPQPGPDFERHYALAHGNLCLSAADLARLGIAGMTPGFLSAGSLEEMRTPVVPFGERADNLSQGLFTFVLNDAGVSPHTLFGHQGMAYGAVHGLFFDPILGKGAALLTTGASEARRGVLADLNAALLSCVLGDDA